MPSPRYDVVVIGGAFSGAAAALLLRREHPDLTVLVVERSGKFDEKVGEATTEMSAMFMTRRLALWEHLERNHLPKEGLRYWFRNGKVRTHDDASEAGGSLRSSVPSFQLRRDVLDEHILKTAVEEGAELLRPARVLDLTLADFDNTVVVDEDGTRHEIRCRWVIDASGRANVIGRKLGIIERNDDHPIAAIWARWRGVKHIDDLAARKYPMLAVRNTGSRRLGTNHYMGRGFWIWVIPLGNGETSIGVVFDRRLVSLHQSTNREADFVAFLQAATPLGELIEGAELRSEDLRFYSHLPYFATQYAGRGWALVGDAASFLDPYYSPGLDHAAFSVEAAVNAIGIEKNGGDIEAWLREHNETFVRSYRRFFESIYRDKYYYMGEHDLLTASFFIETAQYYIFVVTRAYRILKRFDWMPVLGPKPAFISYHLMRIYNRRFKKIAETRRRLGEAGRRNDHRRAIAYFNLSFAPTIMAARGIAIWMVAEIDLVRLRLVSLFRRAPGTIPDAARTAAEEQPASEG